MYYLLIYPISSQLSTESDVILDWGHSDTYLCSCALTRVRMHILKIFTSITVMVMLLPYDPNPLTFFLRPTNCATDEGAIEPVS